MTLPETLAFYRGALATGLRSYPLNLLWVMPAKGGVMGCRTAFIRDVTHRAPRGRVIPGPHGGQAIAEPA
jgi:hypothetical protein